MSNTTLSVIIPTKNRHELLLQLILALDGKLPHRIQYVIHDNSDHALELPTLTQPERWRYAHDPNKLSFGQNFSKALAMAQGDFVCMMGDDDWALHGHLLQAMDRCESEQADIVVTPNMDLLFHPGTSTRWSGQYQQLSLVRLKSLGRMLIALMYWISRLSTGIKLFWLLQPDLWTAPRVYFGLVRRQSLLDSLPAMQAGQNIFLSPDSFMMGAVSRMGRRLYLTKPMVLVGTSARSGSQLSNVRRHVGSIRHHPNLAETDLQRLPANTPDYFFPEVFWACAYLAGRGQTRFGDMHLQTLRCFVWLKYRIWMSEADAAPWYRPLSVVLGAGLGAACFVANRLLVTALILARYVFSDTQVVNHDDLVREQNLS
jgi:hypothetical protein